MDGERIIKFYERNKFYEWLLIIFGCSGIWVNSWWEWDIERQWDRGERGEKDYSKRNRMKSELCLWNDNIDMIWVVSYWNDVKNMNEWG